MEFLVYGDDGALVGVGLWEQGQAVCRSKVPNWLAKVPPHPVCDDGGDGDGDYLVSIQSTVGTQGLTDGAACDDGDVCFV